MLKGILRHWRLLFFVLLLIAALGIYQRLDLSIYLQPNGIDLLRSNILSLGWKGVIGILFIYVLFVTLGLPNLPFQLAAGAIYGVWTAFAIMFIGVNLGALAAFGLARTLSRKSIEALWGHHLRGWNKRIEKGGFRFLLILRLIPLLPFNLINYASGISRLKFKNYLAANLIGMIPLTFLHVMFGHGATHIDPSNPKTWLDPLLIGPLAGACTIIVIVFFSKSLWRRFRT